MERGRGKGGKGAGILGFCIEIRYFLQLLLQNQIYIWYLQLGAYFCGSHFLF